MPVIGEHSKEPEAGSEARKEGVRGSEGNDFLGRMGGVDRSGGGGSGRCKRIVGDNFEVVGCDSKNTVTIRERRGG